MSNHTIQNNASVVSSAFTSEPDEEAGSVPDPLLGRSTVASTAPVFSLVNRCKSEVTAAVDTVLSITQLQSTTVNYSLIRPLRLALSGSSSSPPAALPYALLVARAGFLYDAKTDIAFEGLNTTRANVCELLAVKSLSHYGQSEAARESSSQPTLLAVLTTRFAPTEGATADMFEAYEGMDDKMLAEFQHWGRETAANALEVAVFSCHAKRFLSSPLVAQTFKAIETGQVLYAPESSHSIVQDRFKPQATAIVYRPEERPLLDYHMLRVPRVSQKIEFITFSLLLILWVGVLATNDISHIGLAEGLFIAVAAGMALEEYGSVRQNGLSGYLANAFNTLDVLFLADVFLYLVLRLRGLRIGDDNLSQLALEVLALAPIALLPRLTFAVMKDSVLLLALTSMLSTYVWFIGITIFTLSGFYLALYSQAQLNGTEWGWEKLGWLLVKVFLGSSFLAFAESEKGEFGVFGTATWLVFSIVTGSLLITILVSLLSNVFAAVSGRADEEIAYQKALRTLERLQADPLGIFPSPLNILALVVLLPTSLIASPRWQHKIAIALTKTLNFPTLFVLAVLSRARSSHASSPLFIGSVKFKQAVGSLPRGMSWDYGLEGVSNLFSRDLTAEGTKVDALDHTSSSAAPAAEQQVPFPSADVARTVAHTRSASLGPRQQHNRFNSLSASPLARMFALPELSGTDDRGPLRASAPPSSTLRPAPKPSNAPAAGTADSSAALEARLEAIEKALSALLLEVTKRDEDKEEEPKGPITGLAGETEE